MEYDDLIIGSGSTGAVIAARLSEQTSHNVLLIEAGMDHADINNTPQEILSPHGAVFAKYNWPFHATVRQPNLRGTIQDASKAFMASSNKSRISMAKTALQSTLSRNSILTQFVYPMGRVLGGSSAVNGALAIRGAAEDYDEWAKMGNPLWSWSNVKNIFCEIESDKDINTSEFGQSGPVPVERAKYNTLHPVQRDFYDTCTEIGFPVGEPNQQGDTGVGCIPRNVRDNIRISTALAYLAPVRERSNLTIKTQTVVQRILMENNKAIGVEVVCNGKIEKHYANNIIISAGAINTPAILMRSGIGSAEALRKLDIQSNVILPGVGQNLIDHPTVGLWMVPKEGVCHIGEDIHQVMLRYTSAGSTDFNDLQLYMLSSVDTTLMPELRMALGAPTGMSITTVLGKPASRGYVELSSKDPTKSPKIYLNIVSDPTDILRLMEGVRMAWKILNKPRLKKYIERIFAWNDTIINSDKLLHETISTFARGSWHPVGTARMGPVSDPMAVVDQYGSVHGCENLTVADASIMPTIPRVPTNLSCIMIGEQISKYLKTKDHPEKEKSTLTARNKYIEYTI